MFNAPVNAWPAVAVPTAVNAPAPVLVKAKLPVPLVPRLPRNRLYVALFKVNVLVGNAPADARMRGLEPGVATVTSPATVWLTPSIRKSVAVVPPPPMVIVVVIGRTF